MTTDRLSSSELTSSELTEITDNPYKKDFPLLAQNPEVAYLDSAATSQRPSSVIEAQKHFYEAINANALRGLYRLSVDATAAIEDARKALARFIGAVDADGTPRDREIIFTRNTSESLNLVASSLGRLVLKPGDDVVISIMEHHSNIIPWQQICAQTGARLVYLRMNDAFEITQEELESKITERAKIVSVTQVSNVLGVSNDISAIARRAHAMGAYMVVDAAQSAPHLPIDVRTLDCDLLAFSAHKMCGPMGIGILWGKADILNRMPPFLTGGEMIDSVTETGAVWAPIPEKFEAGTQDGAGICATGEAIAYLEGLGMTNIEKREALLARHLTERLNELDFIDIIGPQNGARHVGAVSFNVRGVHPHDVSSILDMDNVCIRAGHHCAEPLLTELGQSSTCRASVAFYNDASDIDQLVSGLARVWSIFNGN